MKTPLNTLPLPVLYRMAEKELQYARRNVGCAWRIIEEAKLALRHSK